MGYRSDVAYTIRFEPESYNKPESADDQIKAKESFHLFIAEAKAKEETAGCFSQEDSDVFIVVEDKLEIRFFAQNVKWYEDYSDVKRHEELISLSKAWADENPYIGGAFARVGEDLTDLQEECWGQGEYQWISIARSVCVDWE
jgi:hypothetical protein